MSTNLTTKYLVKPDTKVQLKKWPTKDSDSDDKDKSEKELEALQEELGSLQALLAAGRERKLLIVLQGMDAAGKDSTIQHVFKSVNPQGVNVAAFKVPTPVELDHDFLWRIHAKVPGKGETVIFNRSHYEDVLAVAVKDLAPKEIWQKRFEHINNFEKLLSGEGTVILKFFLHIDEDEQRKRLADRLKDPTKFWKFSANDVKERELWPAYMKAYEDALSRTSTSWAPWYIIPANVKWYRNLVILSVIVDTLKNLSMKYPQPRLKAEEIKKMIAKIE